MPSKLELLRTALAQRGRVATAARKLGAMGAAAESAVPDLIAALWRRKGGGHREICTALGDIGARPDMVVPALVKVLHHESMELAGITAVGRFGPDARAALPALAQRAGHADPTTRYAVAEARWRITGDTSFLTGRLHDASESVRLDAVSGLAEAGDRTTLRRVAADETMSPDVRREAREALADSK